MSRYVFFTLLSLCARRTAHSHCASRMPFLTSLCAPCTVHSTARPLTATACSYSQPRSSLRDLPFHSHSPSTVVLSHRPCRFFVRHTLSQRCRTSHDLRRRCSRRRLLASNSAVTLGHCTLHYESSNSTLTPDPTLCSTLNTHARARHSLTRAPAPLTAHPAFSRI